MEEVSYEKAERFLNSSGIACVKDRPFREGMKAGSAGAVLEGSTADYLSAPPMYATLCPFRPTLRISPRFASGTFQIAW